VTMTTTSTATEFAARRESYERLREAVRGYGFSPALIRAGSGYRVEGPTGPHFLKRFGHSPAEALFVYHGLEHLRSHGFPEAPRIHLTRDGRPFIAPGGELYYLQDWLDLTPADLTDPASLGAAVDLLCRMHRAGEGFTPPAELGDVRNDYGSWLDKCVGRLRELYSFAELAEDSRKESKFDARYAKASLGFARQAEEAVRRLADLPLARVAQRDRDAGALCHRNFTPGNLALDSRSRLRVLDFDSSAREIRLDDVAKFVRRAAGADADRAAFILERYAAGIGKALDETELGLLSAYLLFPMEFWSIGNSRFRKNRRRERALRRVLDAAEGWAAFSGALRELKLDRPTTRTAPEGPHDVPASRATDATDPAPAMEAPLSVQAAAEGMPVPDGPHLPSVPFDGPAGPPVSPEHLVRYDEVEVAPHAYPASWSAEPWSPGAIEPAAQQPGTPWLAPTPGVPGQDVPAYPAVPCWQYVTPPEQPVAHYQWHWAPAEGTDPTAGDGMQQAVAEEHWYQQVEAPDATEEQEAVTELPAEPVESVPVEAEEAAEPAEIYAATLADETSEHHAQDALEAVEPSGPEPEEASRKSTLVWRAWPKPLAVKEASSEGAR